MRCPHCQNHLLQKSGERTRLRIQGPVVIENGVAVAKCFWCNEPVRIPIKIDDTTPIPAERFILAPK
jgi:RNase P subunit RPR2